MVIDIITENCSEFRITQNDDGSYLIERRSALALTYTEFAVSATMPTIQVGEPIEGIHADGSPWHTSKVHQLRVSDVRLAAV